MEIKQAPRGILEIDDAWIIHRNFAGEGSIYNREGDRNFSLVIPDEDVANELREDGWNIKIKPPREEGDAPFMFLPIKIKCNERGPIVYLESGGNQRRLEEDEFAILDRVSIARVDLDVRPYDWEFNGKTGRTAYLQSMRVVQKIVDRFAVRDEDFDIE